MSKKPARWNQRRKEWLRKSINSQSKNRRPASQRCTNRDSINYWRLKNRQSIGNERHTEGWNPKKERSWLEDNKERSWQTHCRQLQIFKHFTSSYAQLVNTQFTCKILECSNAITHFIVDAWISWLRTVWRKRNLWESAPLQVVERIWAWGMWQCMWRERIWKRMLNWWRLKIIGMWLMPITWGD